MREASIRARKRRRYVNTTDSNHTFPAAPNLLARDFDPKRPDEVWASDITGIPTKEGWLYLAVVLDLYSRRVVGWATSARMDAQLALDSLRMASERRDLRGPAIHHSDQGSQYASDSFRHFLRTLNMACSMSRRANCWDNAVVESFFATLKGELNEEVFPTRGAARSALFEYIETWYNPRRRHSHLGYLSPTQYEAAVA